jgi:hypothetical protein
MVGFLNRSRFSGRLLGIKYENENGSACPCVKTFMVYQKGDNLGFNQTELSTEPPMLTNNQKPRLFF